MAPSLPPAHRMIRALLAFVVAMVLVGGATIFAWSGAPYELWQAGDQFRARVRSLW